MNIISLLFMHITQKRGDIAILKAMGLADGQIRRIFFLSSSFITACAAFFGTCIASGAGWLLDRYPIITLPDAYYVTQLPVKVEWYLALLVFVVVMIVSSIATWLPVSGTRNINIAQVLRFEA